MRVLIAGAGAAGLSLAARLAESGRSYDVSVLERRGADERPGFGITLRREALSFLDLERMVSGVQLHGRTLWQAGRVVVDFPNPPDTHLICFSRAEFISALTARCVRQGVNIRYGEDAAALGESELEDFDLVVAADGADSAVRRRFSEHFGPRTEFGRNRYGWFGASKPFPKLTVMLPDVDGALAWGYRYSPMTSTFIVELTESRFSSSGLEGRSADDTAAYVKRMFADELGPAEVFCGAAARWMRFGTVTNTRLRHQKVVLIGDAAHTTHFSQGLGTMFAFDDVRTLHSVLESQGSLDEALDAYESLQQPKIAEFQQIATASMRWSETLLQSIERGDKQAADRLIEQRWAGNAVPPAPLIDAAESSPSDGAPGSG